MIDSIIPNIGMGCWPIGGYGWGSTNDEESRFALMRALELGIFLFDTADTYGFGHSELLIAKTFGTFTKNILISTKGGVKWDEQGKVMLDTSPMYIRSAVEASLKRLKLESIPLYYVHKPDGITPIEDTIFELKKMIKEGKIQRIGLSNFSPLEVERALMISPIHAIQCRANIFELSYLMDYKNIIESNKFIKFVAYGVLADGLLTGKYKGNEIFSENDHRSKMNQYSPENFPLLVEKVRLISNAVLRDKQTIAGLSMRAILDCFPNTSCLFGAKNPMQVDQNFASYSEKFDKSQFDAMNMIIAKLKH